MHNIQYCMQFGESVSHESIWQSNTNERRQDLVCGFAPSDPDVRMQRTDQRVNPQTSLINGRRPELADDSSLSLLRVRYTDHSMLP